MAKISTKSTGRRSVKNTSAKAGGKATEPTARCRVKDIKGASQALLPSVGQPRREKLPASAGGPVTDNICFVPVLNPSNHPIDPTTPKRAKELLRSGKAIRRWFNGKFCIKLTVKRVRVITWSVVGIDPGSKREGFTVKSQFHTYFNVLSDAVTWVKEAVEVRRNMRRSRRFRKTPCRKNKYNRSKSPFPPSTKARWQAKLRVVNWLRKMFPIAVFVVEDIKAKTWKGSKKWNRSFSPLEVGKKWFYQQLLKLGKVCTMQGYNTKELRDRLGLVKTGGKLKVVFSAHNVDSWVLANWYTGGHTKPDNENLFHIVPLRFHRRQLHRFEAKIGGQRLRYGGTMSLGLKKGTLVKHKDLGICYIGGSMNKRISLHSYSSSDRLTQNASKEDIVSLAFNSWRMADSSAS